ncbi:hypothetical protein ACFL27_01145 [candidate division CSSED10-310 bacterium]|uniref:DUF5683 domain-containing protein n=1 Tax=candidate division CSSED10-310 bacterium TaxID=2855610 RepID=A0ABV6YRF0_UNCC1
MDGKLFTQVFASFLIILSSPALAKEVPGQEFFKPSFFLSETDFSQEQAFFTQYSNHLPARNAFFNLEGSVHSSPASRTEGYVWGGIFLTAGVGCTLYGFLERGIFYSQKSIVRNIDNNDGTVSELHFTLYQKNHASPYMAMFTSLGLFFNGTYWMLKDSVEGVDMAEFSLLFSEQKMAAYSIGFGSLVILSAFLSPEYSDEARRGYEIATDSSGRIQYFPIQDERRLYSYRQFSVNMGAGLIYIGFGVWKLLFNDRAEVSFLKVKKGVRCYPVVTPNSLALNFLF